MKYLTLILAVILGSCCYEPEVAADPETSFKSYRPYFLKYVKTEYVVPAEIKLLKLEKQSFLLSQKINNAKAVKQSMKSKLLEADKEIESLKLWPLYYKALLIDPENNTRKYAETQDFIAQIKLRFKELNDHEFPDIEQEFRNKYLTKK